MRDVKIILVLIFILIINSIYSNEKKKILNYEDIDWKNYRWWEKWYDFNPDVNYPESPKIAEYLKLEAEGKLPKNVHIYRDDPMVNEYKKLLIDQKSSISKVMEINIDDDRTKIINGSDDFDELDYEYYSRLINPLSIDFLLWIYEKFKSEPEHPYNNAEGLCDIAFWMTKDPDLFKEEIIYYEKKIIPFFRDRIKGGNYDSCILESLYLLGHEDEALSEAAEAGKISEVKFNEWYHELYSFKKNIRIPIADPKIKPYTEKLLYKSGRINEVTQYSCLLYFHWLGEIDKHFEKIFQIIDDNWYGDRTVIDHYMLILLDNKKDKILKYFQKNIDNHKFSSFKDRMQIYIDSYASKDKIQ